MSAFPFSAAALEGAPVAHRAPLPAAADAVVIGGGIAGLSAAWFLRQKGLSVVLCEKGRVGAEQSGRNWGWVRVQGRDPAEIPLALEARGHWADWAERLGEGLGYRRVGVTYFAESDKDLARFEGWLEHARGYDLDSRMLSRAETEALAPNAVGWKGALHTASDCKAEPWVAVPGMARFAADAGLAIREGCAVRALDIAGGRVCGVITEDGPIRTDTVVLAGGAWSSLFLRAHGVALPQLAVLSSVGATGPMPAFFEGAATDSRFALRRRADGGYTLAHGSSHKMYVGPDAFRHFGAYLAVLKSGWRSTRMRPAAPRGFPDAWTTARRWSPDAPGPFEAMRVLDPAPDRRALEDVLRAFARTFPDQPRPHFAATWGGMIDTMPDVVPVLDRIEALPGLTLGTGLSGHGFGIGPAVGRVLADLALGNAPGHDLSRFRFARFSDGSSLEPGPSL